MDSEKHEGAQADCDTNPSGATHQFIPTQSAQAPREGEESQAYNPTWRKTERERLIAARLAIPVAQRHSNSKKIITNLKALLGDLSGKTIGVYWPFRGEPDLREWMNNAHEQGGVCALPVVVKKHAPVVFRVWQPDCKMEHGIWNIPIPTDGLEVIPDIIILPVVGYDSAGYRLGYGGGFYDRTLAAYKLKPRTVGVGHSQAKLVTIHPQPHDIPVDVVITEQGLMRAKL